MSIDELLGLTVAELQAMTDEQLLQRYEPIFNLEQQAINSAVPTREVDSTEDDEENIEPIKKTRKKERREKISDLKDKLMKLSVEDDFK